jgi:AraC family transcriptional regulator of adaptative response / DNA-3-methyladenine glycosylase II
MLLDHTLCYNALCSRDYRFDGRFFVGVSSTSIYCRPICRVKKPKASNCSFFPSAAAAEKAGYRPCLKCRPELAPGQASVDAADRLAHTAAHLIEDGFLIDTHLRDLAYRLAVSDRHLRRVFADVFGVTPVAYAQTQRLLLAKRLLTDTAMPIADIAMAAGFGSLRRFNNLFQTRYRLTPTAIRHVTQQDPAGTLVFELAYRPPYAWSEQMDFLNHRAIAGVETVISNSYYRTVAIPDPQGALQQGWLMVSQQSEKAVLRVQLSASLARVIPQVLSRLKRLFDLACNPDDIARQLGNLAAARPGLRVPGAFDGFEMAVRAVLGQQVTVRAARTLAGRFAHQFGLPVETPYEELNRTFPSAEIIASKSLNELAALGITGKRCQAILALAQGLSQGNFSLEPDGDLQEQIEALRGLPGIGEWTAQYIAMRALAWPDAFPHSDYGIRKALNETSSKRILAIAETWRPWRAYATLHLWRSLETKSS